MKLGELKKMFFDLSFEELLIRAQALLDSDPETALHCLRFALIKRSPDDMLNYVKAFDEEELVYPDAVINPESEDYQHIILYEEEIEKMLRMLHEKGFYEATLALSERLEGKEGENFMRFIEDAAKNGDSEAQRVLGERKIEYLDQYEIQEDDLELLKASAAQGNIKAINRLSEVIDEFFDDYGFFESDLEEWAGNLPEGEIQDKILEAIKNRNYESDEISTYYDFKTNNDNGGLSPADKKAIAKFFSERKDVKYSIDAEGRINVNGDVTIYKQDLVNGALPIRFGIVNGDYVCTTLKLKSLSGAPTMVSGKFDCSNNSFESLEGCPMIVGDDFNCSRTGISNLEGGPVAVGGYNYDCSDCLLETLDGAPKAFYGSMNTKNNFLE